MFWRRKSVQEKPDSTATLERRLEELDSAFRMLKGEWLDTLDRLERMMGRLSKRFQRDSAAAAPPETPPNGQHAPEVPLEVLKRRSGGRFPGRHDGS